VQGFFHFFSIVIAERGFATVDFATLVVARGDYRAPDNHRGGHDGLFLNSKIVFVHNRKIVINCNNRL